MSGNGRSYDSRNNGWLSLMVLAMMVGAWFLAVRLTYRIPADQYWTAHWYALLATPTTVKLWFPVAFAFAWGLSIFVVVANYFRTFFQGADFVRRLRGPEMISAAQLKDRTRERGKKQLRLMGIPVPTKLEDLHFSVSGSTGTGKSQVIADYIDSAHGRNDRSICVDPNGGFMKSFWKEGDVILNPFDARGLHWSIFNEVRSAYDVELYSVATIPRAPSTEQEQWNSMARTIVSEVMLKLKRLGRDTTDDLVYWLCQSSNDQLKEMLADTAAAGMFHGAEETLGSVRTVLTRYITPHKYLSDNIRTAKPFSIRDWLENGTGNMWITWREDMLPALKPLISCWVDVICACSLSTEEDIAETMHMILDEVDSLEKLNYLVEAATKARKHKFKIFTGFQSYAQLDDTNGKDGAMTLRGSLRNSVSLGVSEFDTYSADQVSKALGEHEVTRRDVSQSAGTSGGKASSRYVTNKELLVYPSQVHNLPNLTGYVKFAGDMALARVTLKYKKRPKVVEPIIMIEGEWTSIIQPKRTGPRFGKQRNAVV